MADYQINLYDEHEAIQEDLARKPIEIEKITWEGFEPADFPCAACDKNQAVVKRTFRHKEITVKLCLCTVCVNLPETILIERIFGG